MLPNGPYNPVEHEDKIYQLWEKGGCFKPRGRKGAESYTIVLPPPNVTGTLHVGHALTIAIEDILIRYARMLGKRTLWLPGTDHAAIATQSKVEQMLHKEEGVTRHDLGREKFLKRVEEFAQQSHDTIIHQAKRMGASCDWTREAYTLDEQRNLAVRTAFKKMYDLGLIYRGQRIVNWDPKLQTTVSDEEVEWKEEKVPFYYFKYGPFIIGTARPETKFGDKYIVVHPDDKRYKNYKAGQKFEAEWINGPVTATVIKDAVIDMEFGTGAMTITPWHDQTDFDLAEKYNLDKEQIIDFNGRLMPIAGDMAGMKIKEAREKIVAKLKEKGLLVKVEENYLHRVATNSRGGGMIEPQIKEQWFVDVNKKFVLENSKLKKIKKGQKISLKELMRLVVESGEIQIIPEHFEKIYFHWIDNLRDWCISRQIWYGHRLPVWYKSKETYVGVEPPTSKGWQQDPDTLDTWFSSGLWTFSTLGWPASPDASQGGPASPDASQGGPEKIEDLKAFHPTSVLETGYDILFFWVARMILMTTCLLGEIPFHYVYLHGLVRDKDKQKMSKSKGNAIDPLGVIEDYGTDALRMALVFGTGQGSDVAISIDKILAQKKFANKIWNASRFILMNLDKNFKFDEKLVKQSKHKDDKQILTALNQAVKQVSQDLDNFMFHEAAQTIYQFFWHDVCDIYLEAVKARLKGENKEDKVLAQNVLYCVLLTSLKLLHPFMPFITETVWQELPDKSTPLIISEWPK